MTPSLRVIQTGPTATIQDLGRPGWFSSGVGVAGAADPLSLKQANALVGNSADAAGIECLLGGLALEALSPVRVAITGAVVPVSIGGRSVAHGAAVDLAAGQRLALGMATAGLRAYVAVRGGIAVPEVLGSRSRDTLAGIGPEPLRPDSILPVGDPPEEGNSPVSLPISATPITEDPVVLRVELGPRQDWFVNPKALFSGSWITSDAVDRVGARLTREPGQPALIRANDRELPTEGMPLGAIQIPPSGEPVIFLADHPITGGYPVIGCVVTEDVRRMAQARPGQQVVFRPNGEVPGDGPDDEPGRRPAIRITGHPTESEAAAVLAVLAAISSTPAADFD